MNNILVSIICNTYNHEKYIKEALEGFIMQKTKYRFEALIHDDASTDGTATIIKEYADRYPDIIKPILQTENQFSKHVKINATYQYPRVSGKYIAMCEGDDYWTDPYKLQKQFDAMEEHPEIDMCAHGTMKRYPDGKEVPVSNYDHTEIISPEQVIKGGGLSISTCSLFYRTSMLNQKWRFREFMGYDYTMKIHGALRGGILCLPDVMGVYRFMSGPSSWTSRILKDSSKEIEHTKKRIQMLTYLDEDTDYRFTNAITETKNKLELSLLWYQDDYKTMKQEKYHEQFEKMPKKKRFLVNLGCVIPGPVKLFHKHILNRYIKQRAASLK